MDQESDDSDQSDDSSREDERTHSNSVTDSNSVVGLPIHQPPPLPLYKDNKSEYLQSALHLRDFTNPTL